MKIIFRLLAVIVWGGVGYLIGVGVADWYSDTLKGTGGMIMATDLIGIQMIPIVVAALAAMIAARLLFDE